MLRTTACSRALIAALTLGCGDQIVNPARLELTDARHAVLLDACPAGATRWAAAVNGSWTDAARWTAGVPTAAKPACIDLPGSYVVTAALFAGMSAQQLFVGVPGAVTQPTLRITHGTVTVSGDATVHGRVEINAPSGVSAALIASGALSVASTGTLTTGDNGTKTYQAELIDNAGTIVVGAAPTSVSRLTLRAGTISNRGTLSVPAGRHLFLVAQTAAGPTVTFEAGQVDGSGTLQQTNGRLDVVGGSMAGKIDIFAPAQLHLAHDGGGRFNLFRAGSTPQTSALTGTIGAAQHVWAGNMNLTVVATDVVNHGQLSIQGEAAAGSTAMVFRVPAGSTLTNAATGTITMIGNGNGVLAGAVTNEGLLITAPFPAGTTGNATLRPNSFVNRGTLRVIGGTGLHVNTVTGEPAPHFVNDGGRLELTGPFDQNGGRFEHRDGAVSNTGGLTLSNLQWSGFGTWARSLTLGGTSSGAAPGGDASPGRIAITGDYVPATTTTTRIELAGDDAGTEYDQVAVSGTARFAGPLSVSLLDGFVPRPCQTFTVVTYAARTGTFTNAATPIDVGGGMKLRQVYTANALVLVAYDAAGPNVHPTEVTVSVDGQTATYDVCMGAGTDVVTVLPDDQVRTDKATLTFGASQLPQTVTVSAAPSASKSEGLIRHTASSGTPVASVRVIIEGVVPPDTDAPVTTATATPAASIHGWNNSDVTVQLSATDAGSGVERIEWSLSGAQIGSGSANGSAATVSVTAEGITTLAYSARDVAGNVEAPKTLVVRIDRTAPTVVVTRNPPPGPDGWNYTNVTATFSASDALSGIDGAAVAEVVFSETGANQSATREFADRAGNVASATISGISIDKTPASLACSATPNEIWPANNKLVAVSIDVTFSHASGFVLERVTSNEPGAGDIVDFATGTNDTRGQLRATRNGGGPGRIYTFEYRTVGGASRATATCQVRVPHDQRNK